MSYDSSNPEEIVQHSTGRKFLNTVKEHAFQLSDFEEAIQSFNMSWDVQSGIAFLETPFEIDTDQLIECANSDNTITNKYLLVVCTLCQELITLKKEGENNFFQPFLMYGCSDQELKDGDPSLMISKLLPTLIALNDYLSRVEFVIAQTVSQLAILYGSSVQQFSMKNVRLLTLYEHFAGLLECIIILDEIIVKNDCLSQHWNIYKRMFKSVNVAPGRFNASKRDVSVVEQLNHQLEERLLQGMIFTNCIDQNFNDSTDLPMPMEENVNFLEDMEYNIKQFFTHLDSKIGQPNEQGMRRQVLGVFGLYVLYYALSKKIEKRFLKTMWDLHKKAPVVWISGNLVLYPCELLKLHFPDIEQLVDKRSHNLSTIALAFLQQEVGSILRETQNFQKLVTLWMLKFDSIMSQKREFETKATTLIQGLNYATKISRIVKTVTALHVNISQAMRAQTAVCLMTLTELLKAIEMVYSKRNLQIVLHLPLIMKLYSSASLGNLRSTKDRLLQDPKYDNQPGTTDILGFLTQMENNLESSNSQINFLVADVSLCMVLPTLKGSLDTVFVNLRKLQFFSNLFSKIQVACDCSFLYWQPTIIPAYFKKVYEDPSMAQNLNYMFGALNDSEKLFNQCPHVEDSKGLKQKYQQEILAAFQEQIIDKLCHDIETDLRLQIHSHLQLDDRNPFRSGFRNSSLFLNVPPLKIFDSFINIKKHVEHYLNLTFYKHTTLALHDWKTYVEMRNLAERIYCLDYSHDPLLPSQTLEQGLDVLVIMRRIHVFVSRFNYNLNNQFFVEKTSDNKHLNTISIQHIANSMRTHGLGILNTTVNFTYQFLRKKFNIFSQFLYDDHIKSRLIKDIRAFKDRKANLETPYPFETAQRFNRGIRKLGLSAKNESYLDRFRVLLTQIGNAMGYIRTLRSGCLHYLSDSVRFVPDLKNIPEFKFLCESQNLSPEVVAAADNVDNVLESLIRNFSEGTEYFNILVEVFQKEFHSEKNVHLRNFYGIIPPLTLNYVEHIILSKEKLSKRSNDQEIFTDDGFPMGMAYVLKLLNQQQAFDSLHWFETAAEHYSSLTNDLKNTKNKLTKEEQQTNVLTAKRYISYQREFELLYYTLSSARIFFRKAGDTPVNKNNIAEETIDNLEQ